MNDLHHFSVEGGVLPKTEHRISIAQIGIALTAFPPGGSPSGLVSSDDYLRKLKGALTIALRDNWSNAIVFPEISVPVESLPELMGLCADLVASRRVEAGGCVICLPLEHLSLTRLEQLIIDLAATDDRFIPGDIRLSNGSASDYLFEELPPAEHRNAFVNVAVLLVFGQSESNSKGCYFFQPKLFPYPQERTPRSGRFVHGALTYVLDVGGVRFMTGICFDLIAQPPGSGLIFSNLIQEARSHWGTIHYLLLPQCNDSPLDGNFQRAIADLYLHSQVDSERMRAICANVAQMQIGESVVDAGHSWLTTSPFGSELPPLGIWERILASALKDPTTGEIVRDAPSLGYYAQRLRISADGEWILHISLPSLECLSKNRGPNVPLPPHTGTVYGWNGSEWMERDAELFQRDCFRAERLPGLQVLVELAQWVQENMGGKNAYSPSYQEFTEHRVCLPESEKCQAITALNSQYDVWVRGKPACGKTVFGLGIAFQWMLDANGRCVFLDFRDLPPGDLRLFARQAKSDIEWLAQMTTDPILAVLDNIHINPQVANDLLRHVQKMRRSGFKAQALLLGRYHREQPEELTSLSDNESLSNIQLEATEESYTCVAKRLLWKSAVPPDDLGSKAGRWLNESGGDLVAFALAFDPLHPGLLDRASIAESIRCRYIASAEEQGEHSAFIDLCVLSSLDLDTEDSEIWGKSAEALFPRFVDDGILLRLPPKVGNPRSYCHLFHPSMGALVIRVDRNFSETEARKLWISCAISLCWRQPFLLSLMHFRLASKTYENVLDFTKWCAAINGEDGLVEHALCDSPYWTTQALRKGGLEFSWNRIENAPGSSAYDLLLKRLAQTQAHNLVQFLKYLNGNELGKASQGLLKRLLKNGEFKSELAQTPPHLVVQFLKYLDSNELGKASQGLLKRLLKNGEFKSELAQTPPHLVVQFLKYLDSNELGKASQGLLKRLLKNGEFKSEMVHTPCSDIVTFLKYLDDNELLRKESQALLDWLLKDTEFKSEMVYTPCTDIVSFLKYLGSNGRQTESKELLNWLLQDTEFLRVLIDSPPDQMGLLLVYLEQVGMCDTAQRLLDDNVNQLDIIAFRSYLSRWSPHLLAGLQGDIGQSHLHLTPELWTTLIKKARGKSYHPVVPDPEYTQDRLLSMHLGELTELMLSLANGKQRFKLNCIKASLLTDEERLRVWIMGLPKEEAVQFRRAIIACRLRVPPDIWDLLVELDDTDVASSGTRNG